ncbi:MAG TPA: ATP-binding protein [Smithellaceae bacterium]|jgi:ATP-dependent DNA helicase RecG|nr:transcriptional regulator [Smithella sp.]HNV57935.1 ATP-binding protein [Smithellaceae bacterium]HOD64948.1 ATP-binding protein [Smithellaceae bacterium]HOH57695.1 ATP-binding protein [Smithellaceae bacterium]HOR63161.1 ATP-binding protein [Smithellaceae bacterium]
MRKGENQNKEYKQAWNDNCLKTICAFANTGGGKLFIGIDDEGNPMGVKDAARYLDDIPNKTKDILGITPDVTVKKKAGKDIIEVTVAPSSAPISYHGRFYTRSGSSSVEIKGHALVDLLMRKSGRSWDGFIEEGATLKDIDTSAINKFRKLAAKKIPQIAAEKNVQAILQKLNLLEKGKLRRAAVLLFGKNPKKFYITAYIKIGKFVSATDLISTDDIEGNLFDQVDKAIEMLRVKYLLSNITYEGIYRKDNMEYPEEALREAIINAVIHRNYMGAHTQLRIDPDSLNLWNEGGLPPGIAVADLKKWHLSRPRNELLADVFFKAGMIEAWGRGTVKIVDECKKAGLPEPEFREEFGGLSVHFRKADKAQEAQVEAQEAQVELLNWQREVMKYCFDDEKTGNEIMKIAGYSSRTGNFKKGLQRLLDYQLLELTIPDKPQSRLQKYRLTDKGRRLIAGMRGDKRK